MYSKLHNINFNTAIIMPVGVVISEQGTTAGEDDRVKWNPSE